MFGQVKSPHHTQDPGVGGHLTDDPVNLLGTVGVALDEHAAGYLGLGHLGHGLLHGVSPDQPRVSRLTENQ